MSSSFVEMFSFAQDDDSDEEVVVEGEPPRVPWLGRPAVARIGLT